MSSGRFVSARFSWSFFWMESRVTSTAGLADLSDSSCFLSSSFSSWEPKLLGSVLLRWRTTGPRSSSDIFSFDSEQGSSGKDEQFFIFKIWQWQHHCLTSNPNEAELSCPPKVHQWWLLTFKLLSEFGQIICPFEHFRVGCFVAVGRLKGKKSHAESVINHQERFTETSVWHKGVQWNLDPAQSTGTGFWLAAAHLWPAHFRPRLNCACLSQPSVLGASWDGFSF